MREWFEISDVALRVVVEDNTWIEYIARVEKMFHLFHKVESIGAPFAFDIRSHIAPSAVLGFERAIVVVDNEASNIVHKSLVTIDFGLRVKALVDDEMVVAFEGVTIDDGIVVVVTLEELLKFFGCLDKMVYRESYIFDETSGANGTHTAHRWEDARTDSPILSDSGRIGRKGVRTKSLEFGNGLVDCVDLRVEFAFGFSLHFDEKRHCGGRELLEIFYTIFD